MNFATTLSLITSLWFTFVNSQAPTELGCIVRNDNCRDVLHCFNNPGECRYFCTEEGGDGDCPERYTCFQVGFCRNTAEETLRCHRDCVSCFLVDRTFECGCQTGVPCMECAADVECPDSGYSCDANSGDFYGVCVEPGLTAPCLSAYSTVLSGNGKELPIGKLNMQDEKIATVQEDGTIKYQEMYAFGHYNLYAMANFLRIETAASADSSLPLEISREHLLFQYDKNVAAGVPVRADTIRVGDFIITKDGSQELVTDVSTVERQGLFSPVVTDGTFLANGIKVSSYTATSASVEQLSHHMLSHMTISPFRVLCQKNGGQFSFCQERNADGQLLFAATGERMTTSTQQPVVLLSLVLGFLPFYALEQLLLLVVVADARSYLLLLAAFASSLFLYSKRKNTKTM